MNTLKTRAIWFILLFFFHFAKADAYNLRQLTNKDGLSNSAILSICQDQEGFMWFGSCDGLNRYNGSNISVYKPSNDKYNLSGNLIEQIIETDKDILWIYSNYGLNRLDKKKKTVDHFKNFRGEILIRKDKLNNLFIIKENNSIYYYLKNSNLFKKITLPGLLFENTLNFCIDNDVLWIFTKNGACKRYRIDYLEDGEMRLMPLKNYIHSSKLRFCFNDQRTVYFIDDTYTLFEFDLRTQKKYYIHNLKSIILNKGEVSAIVKHHNDFFVGFKTNGLIRLKNITEDKENYQVEEIDIKAGIFCLYKDRNQDIVWVGTDGQGVYLCFNDSYFIKSTTFNNVTYKIEKPIRALLLDKENTLWIGTKGDGIFKVHQYDFDKTISSGMIEPVTTSNSLLNNNAVYAFANSKRNIIWIGNDDGINYYSFKDKKVKKIEIKTGDRNIKYVHSICETNDSVLWIASVGMGIIKAKIGGPENAPFLYEVKRYAILDGSMASNYFFTINEQNKSSIWFGNRGHGVININPSTMKLKSIQFDKQYNRQLLNDVFSIACDKKDNVWCGTSFGLIKYKPNKKIQIYNEKNGFPNNTVHGILKDSQNNLWLSTNQGIIKFNLDKESFQEYNQNNGLYVTEFSDGAFYKDENQNLLFFGGINGFVTIKETGLPQQAFFPPIYFDNLTIFGNDYNIFDYLTKKDNQKVLELNYNQNFFSLTFTANDYLNGNNYSYLYKLDKVSENWTNNGTSNVVSFTNISPGKYTMLVKYKNRITGRESPIYSIIIKIRPPWYVSTVAYILYYILIIIGIAYLIKSVIKNNRKKREQMLDKLNQHHQEEVYESKLRFFTNIAHEFCTPLTLIYGPCNRILSYSKTDSFITKYTLLIQRNADRLNDLIQELIEFRRIETGNRTPQIEILKVDEIIHDVIDSFGDLAESKNITYSKNIQSPLEWNTDKGFLTVIVTNLISNAFKYVNIDGSIKVTVSSKEGFLTIAVSNTGIGIKDEDIDQIFDRYSILDNFENQEEKTISARNGLGMAITSSLVKVLKGEIKIESIPNHWTDFLVKIPEAEVTIHQEEVHKILPSINIKKAYSPVLELPNYDFDESKPSILIIDDEIEMLWFISEIFSSNFNVIPIDKPTEVEKKLEEMHPDIILCDIMMPHIDGITLTKMIKSNKKTAHIPMILISAKHDIEEKMEGLAAGAEIYITKPFNVDYLKKSVEQLMARKETLKNYFSSPISAFDLKDGQLTHKEYKKFMQQILDIINNNITNKELSAKFIASSMNMSTRHLYRKLESLNAKSPQKMIIDNRLYIAKNLLITTKLTIDEILYKSGFSNRSSFFKAFAEKYKCTPKEYREKNLGSVNED